jgi:dolichol-phosphate mannosyltransferase
MIRLAVDSVTNFSAAPLRIATWLGAVSFFFCLLMMIYVVVAFALRQTVQGWASVLACVLFLGGVQLLCLGLLGEYLGRLYASAQGRPAYFVGFDSAHDDIELDEIAMNHTAAHQTATNQTTARRAASQGSAVGAGAKRNRLS